MDELKKRLLETDYSDLKKFSFEGIKTFAKVVDVYDGDTITVVFYYQDIAIKKSLRLSNIDCPEIKPHNVEDKELYKKAAIISRDYLRNLVLNKIIYIILEKEDKYGRLLGEVYLDDVNINKKILEEGYGKYYKGTKINFTKEEIEKINCMN